MRKNVQLNPDELSVESFLADDGQRLRGGENALAAATSFTCPDDKLCAQHSEPCCSYNME